MHPIRNPQFQKLKFGTTWFVTLPSDDAIMDPEVFRDLSISGIPIESNTTLATYVLLAPYMWNANGHWIQVSCHTGILDGPG